MSLPHPILTVAQYIEQFPKEVQSRLHRIREIVVKNAPEATESISYGMPAYKTHGKVLIYFAAFKNHIGFYATPSGHSAFRKELADYKQGKGSVQFAMNEPLPVELISKIVIFRSVENKRISMSKKNIQ